MRRFMERRVVGVLRVQRAAAMEVLLLAERARRAILAWEAFHGERIAAIMEAISWGKASALSRVFFDPTGQRGQPLQALGALRCERARRGAPGPVAPSHPRRVHPGFAA